MVLVDELDGIAVFELLGKAVRRRRACARDVGRRLVEMLVLLGFRIGNDRFEDHRGFLHRILAGRQLEDSDT